LPSCVGFSASGELLVGEAARNQQALYPERTVRSIKRRMGSPETVMVGGRTFTPPEISALILRELAEWARASLGELPQKAVITVPAYFSDSQRSATREAGALAGLAGLIVAARLNSATPSAGNSFELDVIAACFIGGVSASGGVGKVMGVVIGAFFMGVMNNGMSILGIGIFWQQVVKGIVLLAAVYVDLSQNSKR